MASLRTRPCCRILSSRTLWGAVATALAAPSPARVAQPDGSADTLAKTRNDSEPAVAARLTTERCSLWQPKTRSITRLT
jgi:hypothetical protein